MGNRKQPFGYKMEFGEIVPQPQEAETVRSIYRNTSPEPPSNSLPNGFRRRMFHMTGTSRGTKIW